MTRNIAVYGSLRQKEYNLQRFQSMFGAENMVYKTTVEVPNFKLYSLHGGAYPGIKKSIDDSDTIQVDLFEVAEEVYDAINAMEIGANYIPERITVGNETYTIWVYRGMIEPQNYIKSGDWSTRDEMV